jgi:DNA uptake protein ComE-like DNA-binding protein
MQDVGLRLVTPGALGTRGVTMQLGWFGTMAAALIAAPAIAATSPSAAAPAADTRAVTAAPHAAAKVRATAASAPQAPAPVQHYVDLNRASRKELMTLPGIGIEEARRIIANRPYLTKTDLVAKNVLPVGPYLSLKHLVVAMPVKVSKGGR